jgi:uncharacterized protein
MPKRFNILSLSGGGFLGLYTVSVLAGLEETFEGPIAQHFDLIAGTSVGGIIALGLAAEIPASKIKAAFERNGTAIFSKRPAPVTQIDILRDLIRSLLKPKYQAEALRRTIIEIVPEGTRIGDLKHRVMVPAVNLTRGKPQVFKTPHHIDFRKDLHLKVVDVALATASAPTFFPIAAIDDSLYVDGGLYANSPDLLALHEAEYFLKQPIDDVHTLSIGTTTSQFSFAHAHGRQFGSLAWWSEQRLVNVMIASQQLSTDFMMRHLLGSRYVRLDVNQSKEQERHLALDVATDDAQRTIRGLAETTLRYSVNDVQLKDFFMHDAPYPTFHHRLLA